MTKIMYVSGEDIECGHAVVVGDDGKLYRARPGDAPSLDDLVDAIMRLSEMTISCTLTTCGKNKVKHDMDNCLRCNEQKRMEFIKKELDNYDRK